MSDQNKEKESKVLGLFKKPEAINELKSKLE